MHLSRSSLGSRAAARPFASLAAALAAAPSHQAVAWCWGSFFLFLQDTQHEGSALTCPVGASVREQVKSGISRQAAHDITGQDLDVLDSLFVVADRLATGHEGPATITRWSFDFEVTWKAA